MTVGLCNIHLRVVQGLVFHTNFHTLGPRGTPCEGFIFIYAVSCFTRQFHSNLFKSNKIIHQHQYITFFGNFVALLCFLCRNFVVICVSIGVNSVDSSIDL